MYCISKGFIVSDLMKLLVNGQVIVTSMGVALWTDNNVAIRTGKLNLLGLQKMFNNAQSLDLFCALFTYIILFLL